MNFSAIGRQTLAGRILRRALRFLPPDLEVRVLQGRLRGARWIVGAGVHGYWLGSYEWDKRHLFEAITMPGHIVYDVGANVGFYTILASRLVGPHGRVIAFEPLSRNLEFLRRHLMSNHGSNVTIVEAAVWDASGFVQFEASGDASMGRIHEGGSTRVATVNLDEMVENHSLPPPDLIKMDIEGAELRALRGAASLLENHGPSILLATHGPALHGACCDFLNERGYVLRPIVSGRQLRDVDEVLATKSSTPNHANAVPTSALGEKDASAA